jgi:hypothetical protein
MQVQDTEDRIPRAPAARPLAVPAGADTMGLFVTNALAYQRAGMTGRGIKIAVIDGGFNGLAGLQASGDAPVADSTDTLNFTGVPLTSKGSSHGAACLEVLYDFAPDARYVLYKTNSGFQIGNAVLDRPSDAGGGPRSEQRQAVLLLFRQSGAGALRGDLCRRQRQRLA